ncbi:hypothetical protein ACI2JR_26640 [Klebsiella sp. NPDC088457]
MKLLQISLHERIILMIKIYLLLFMPVAFMLSVTHPYLLFTTHDPVRTIRLPRNGLADFISFSPNEKQHNNNNIKRKNKQITTHKSHFINETYLPVLM